MFYRFPQLPLELRVQIWEHVASHKPILELNYCNIDERFANLDQLQRYSMPIDNLVKLVFGSTVQIIIQRISTLIPLAILYISV